ncbi:MAG: hypothetical protein JXR31_06300 [Prolixibacteraceae bacterium]|nr:hypothetical protein [Prolixibacteraceae bacterium]MBN2773841.1 hypothetical protein [Prolixibacteraceae bacterium]
MRNLFFVILFIAVFLNSYGQKTVNIETTPGDAKILMDNSSTGLSEIGIGTVQLKLGKDPVTVVVEKEGYEPVKKTFIRTGGGDVTEKMILRNRIVKVTSNIYDAEIFQDGILIGKGAREYEILIKENSNVTLSAKSPGFLTKTVVYYNMPGRPEPPVSDALLLQDRVVNITAHPAGTSISADGVLVGEDARPVTIPHGSCVTVTISKEGYANIEKSYCNKENMTAPPVNEVFVLKDRVVQINTSPENAQIKVDGKVVSNNGFKLLVLEDQCVEVEVSKESFDTQRKNYCNTTNMGNLPITDHINLVEDEAWTSSIQSDQANVNFSISVNPAMDEETAWKTLSQIILDKFDILEITDRATGYMRTAWHIKPFSNGTIVRTRVIVKQGNIEPLKYVVKVVSEISIVKNVSVREDENFREWDRLLKTYKDLISEMQARLQ